MEFSEKQMQQLAGHTIHPGEVYRMKLTLKEGVTPKDKDDVSRNKYFIVMGVTSDGCLVGFVLINSEINPYISVRARESHYKIKAEDYPFLQRDRYVCCGELKEIESTEFFNRFKGNIIGKITEEHLEIIRSMMAMSANIPVKILKEYKII